MVFGCFAVYVVLLTLSIMITKTKPKIPQPALQEASKLTPSSPTQPPKSCKFNPGPPKMAPKTPQDDPKILQDGPQDPQHAPQVASKIPQGLHPKAHKPTTNPQKH